MAITFGQAIDAITVNHLAQFISVESGEKLYYDVNRCVVMKSGLDGQGEGSRWFITEQFLANVWEELTVEYSLKELMSMGNDVRFKLVEIPEKYVEVLTVDRVYDVADFIQLLGFAVDSADFAEFLEYKYVVV
jgi:hypothetical protein